MLPMGLVILTGCNGGLQSHCHRPKLLLHEQERQHKKGFKQSTGQLQTFERSPHAMYKSLKNNDSLLFNSRHFGQLVAACIPISNSHIGASEIQLVLAFIRSEKHPNLKGFLFGALYEVISRITHLRMDVALWCCL